MQFSLLYGQQLDIELGSADGGGSAGAGNVLFTTARRKKAVNDAMHNWERITGCTTVFGSIPITYASASAVVAAGGTGYSVNDLVTVVGGTSTVAAVFKVSTVASGVVTAVVPSVLGTYTVLPANPTATTGGTGTGATLTITWGGTAEYDLFTTFTNYISLADNADPAVKKVDASGNVSWIQGDDLPRRDPVWLDLSDAGWRADPSGTPDNWYLRNDAGTTYLGLNPPPSIPTGWTYSILVPYLASSTDMVADGDLPFTVSGKSFARLAPYHQALVHYAAGLLEPLRKNYTGAKRQMDLYAGFIAQYSTKERKDGPDQVTFARNYLRDAGGSRRALDPHRWP